MNNTPLKYDVAVIGSGVCGLAAALTILEGGARTIVFEKQRSLGGSSNFFGGIFAVESELQQVQHIDYTRDQAFKNIMDYSHWRANPRLVRAIVNESKETIAWLQKQGVVFIDATINMPDGPRSYHPVKGTGEAVIKALATQIREKGGEIRPATPVKRILKEGGRITGVIVENNGEDQQVVARSVVVASGGYANNKEWIKKYTGFDLDVNIIPIGSVDKMGDGIRMAWEVGAAEEGTGVLEMFRAGPIGGGFELKNEVELAAGQPNLWVDIYGKRFCDEGIAFYDAEGGNANARGKKNYTFSIFSDSIIRHIVEHGIDRGFSRDNPPGSRPVGLDKVVSNALEKGKDQMFAAESIEELARKMEVDPAILKATVEEYNSYCAKGYDELFAKDRRYLRPLKGPRYYAVKVKTLFLGTKGGIRISENIEVLDKNDKVIQGLYAGGFDAGGMYGDSYCFKVASGMSAGFAVNSGRIAGKNVLKYLKKDSM